MSESPLISGTCGLNNKNSSCFFNSVIQSLRHIIDIKIILKEIENSDVSIEKITFITKVLKVFLNLNQLSAEDNLDEYISIFEVYNDFFNIVNKFNNSGFTKNHQNDAHEFLILIFNIFDEVMSYKVLDHEKYINKNYSESKTLIRYSKEHKKNSFTNKFTSLISESYCSYYTKIINCDNCNTEKISIEKSFDIQLNIQLNANINANTNANAISLYDCLDEHTKDERMSGSNMYYCNICKKNTNANIQYNLWNSPNILIITLKRFSNTLQKNTKHVDFPINDLNLSKYIFYNDFAKYYNLKCIINHYGSSPSAGHYTCFCKNNNDRQWYHYNDSNVMPIDERYIVSNNAYILIYCKCI
jgi:ubiquitin C-terminal hydrolase